MNDRASLTELLRAELARGASLREIFMEADARGLDLAALIDLTLEDWEPAVDHTMVSLVLAVGLERAETIASRSAWSSVEPAEAWERRQARDRAASAIVDELDMREVMPLLAQVAEPWERTQLCHRAATVYALEAIAVAHAHAEDVPEMGAALEQRYTPLEAFDALYAVDRALVVPALAAFWHLPEPGSDEGELALVQALVRCCAQARISLSRVHERMPPELGPELWLPILREKGLRPGIAALIAIEAGTPPVAAADRLRAAGYTHEETFRALLENGGGTRRSRGLLSEHDWSVERLVAALTARDPLASEARDHLRSLKVSEAEQRRLLSAHYPASVVDLVLR